MVTTKVVKQAEMRMSDEMIYCDYYGSATGDFENNSKV
eukprot:CAMPEP_0118689922 /NCGR_PEP_ID=MMETSP0800-20121206/9773_1 /TAXON_ID=210618 ORGANISM="Striatella unipunctata, Strain CCMP2910" /NCGR_SAMPLE_ID=MMETSP0800 /ASSEMBLY_ACC=CAM_ASM_000638 /LENGTH=37 /DNA_ID= /DNA_START= /DNA_END= /DNA_ORIENTATION=